MKQHILISLVLVSLFFGLLILFLAPKVIGDFTEIDSESSGVSGKIQVDMFNKEYNGNYLVLSKTGNESYYNVSFILDDKTKNTIICLETEFDFIEFEAKIEQRYYIPNNLPLYKTEDLIKSNDLIRVKEDELTPTSKDNPNKFCYEADPKKDFYLKFGDNSIIVVQESDLSAKSIFKNVTAESNLSHLNISNNAPYNSLKAYWNFDEVTSNVYNASVTDYSNRNVDGQLQELGAVNESNCIYGSCLQLRNNGYAGGFTTESVGNLGSWTAWFRPVTGVNINDRILFSGDVSGIRLSNLGTTRAECFMGGTGVDASVGSVTLNAWNHVTCVHNGTDILVYVNGVFNVKGAKSSFTNSTSWYVGSRGTTMTNLFDGEIDEVMIFEVPLTSAQVLDIYNNQSARFSPTGEQRISYNMTIPVGNNNVNLTTTRLSNYFDSNITVSLGYYTNKWFFTDFQKLNLFNEFNISGLTTNMTLNYSFKAGINNFISPAMIGNIILGYNKESISYPEINFSNPTHPNGTQTGDSISVNISASSIRSPLMTFIDFGTDMLGWYRMDDINSSGSPSDYFNRNNLTRYGANQTENGLVGKGFKFSGDGDYITANKQLLSGTRASYGGWFKQDNLNCLGGACVIAGQSNGSVLEGYSLYSTAGQIFCWDGINTTGDYSATVNEWHHAMCVHNDTDFGLFIDGELYGGWGPSGFNATNYEFVFGSAENAETYWFNGTMDEMIVFNRSLSLSEVRGLYMGDIESEDIFQNFTGLTSGVYDIKGYTMDTNGQINTTEKRTITIGAGANPSIDITTIYPTGDINVTQNTFINITFNITCLAGTCGTINVSLDPAWNVSSAIPLRNQSIAGQETAPEGLHFRSDGLKVYIIGSSSDRVHEYDLTDAWNISSIVANNSKLVSSQDSSPQDVFIKPDGTKMYMLGGTKDQVYEYNLSSAWAISTASFSQNFSVGPKESQPDGMYFSPDGTSMYIIGSNSDNVHQYTLSNPWHVNSATFLRSESIAVQEDFSTDVFFKPDGLKMYISGNEQDRVHEYDLSTAWNINSASLLRFYDATAEELNPNGIEFKPDGFKMYIIGGNGNDITEYDIPPTITSKGGLINTTFGAIPFYTNSTNPLTTSSLSSGQSELITFWINATGPVDTTYDFYAFANITSNLSIGNETTHWNITIVSPSPPVVDTEYPIFSNFNDNNGSLIDNGTAIFNVTVTHTNGTVNLNINNTNISATNIAGNVYNVSIVFPANSDKTYPYYWSSYGNGTSANYNSSAMRYYTINQSIDACSYTSGNWVISVYCFFMNEVFNIDGNLTINPGGTLNLTNGTLNFTASNQWIIFENVTNENKLILEGYSRIN